MAESTGLSVDTLRWYEREGILPRVTRSAAGHRRYDAREQGIVTLLVALRDTGMSAAAMKQFVELLGEGAASHGRRITLLESSRAMLHERRSRIELAEATLEAKIAHYETLIASGLDCDGGTVPSTLQTRQAARV
ncbi:MerR family transcriptional regulator [Leucobacter sp. NPDC058333]|uniref:MerR family transcriptional regulator n=1 Tax=Leucobacter sp. NPDC058333 TaxID=3346450 RepID=UPI00364A6BE9